MISHMSDVARYLDAMAFARAQAGPWPLGHGPFVTISRQAGSGGHALAEAVMRELSRRDAAWARDWQTFDHALIRMVDEDPRLRDALRALMTEEYYSKGHDMLRQFLMGSVPQDVVLARVFHAVRLLASVGRVVIIGRGAACLTGDLPGGVHVRLVAGRKPRLARLARQWELDPEATAKKMAEVDASRAALVRDHFHRDVDDAELYDAVFNVDRVPVDEVARWVVRRLETKKSVPGGQETDFGPLPGSRRASVG